MDRSRFLRRCCSSLKRRCRPHLPIDIISIILSNLPIDSVVRFRYVSKLWHALISDPVFINIHLARTPLQIILQISFGSADDSEGSGDGGFSPSTARFNLITDNGGTKRESLAITYYRGSQPDIGSIFTSCDGLIYLHPPVFVADTDSPALGPRPPPPHDPMPDDIITPYPTAGGSICNPLLGELIFLPDSHKQSAGSVCAFFFHASSKQYRLLRVTPWPPYVDPPPPCFEYEILALGPEKESSSSTSFSWRSIQCSTSQCPNACPPVILENALYWISASKNPVIMAFDTDTEYFQSIQTPEGIVPKYTKLSVLIEMDGCLCLLQVSQSLDMEMWLLNPKNYAKEGWQKKYTIPKERTGVSWPWPLFYGATCVLRDEIIFYRYECGLLYYNPRLDSFRAVRLCPSYAVSLYRKSLVSLLALNKKSRNHFITSTVSGCGIS